MVADKPESIKSSTCRFIDKDMELQSSPTNSLLPASI